jgi:single-strand DNA-binding protein
MVYLFGPAMERALDPVKGIKKDARVLIDAGNLDKIQWKEAGPDGGEVNRSLAIVRTFGFKPGGAENINKVIIMGRLHKDPEVKFFDGGGCNVSMTISTDRPVKVNDQWVSARTWSDIKLVGKRAETAGEYLRAGRDALVEGWLEVETWTPKGTDKKASKTIIKGFDFVFAGGSGGGSAPASGDMPPMPADDPWGDSSYGPPDDYYGEGAGGGGDRRAPDLDDEIPF